MKKRIAVLDLDDEGEADYAALFPDCQYMEIYHSPEAYFARVKQKAREDTDDQHHHIAA